MTQITVENTRQYLWDMGGTDVCTVVPKLTSLLWEDQTWISKLQKAWLDVYDMHLTYDPSVLKLESHVVAKNNALASVCGSKCFLVPNKHRPACQERSSATCVVHLWNKYSILEITWLSSRRAELLGSLTIDLNKYALLVESQTVILPPARIQDELPPPSMQFQQSVSRWCDFDGED